MNDKIRQHLVEYCSRCQWGTDEDTLIEVIREGKRVYRGEIADRRWWKEYQYVVDVDGMLIGYVYAEANRDESVQELGWEFDPASICEMRAVEKTVIIYEPVPGGKK